MNLPDILLQERINALAKSNFSFALYRLPWTDVAYMVLQTSGEVRQLYQIEDLNRQRGFVIAPFQTTKEHPIVLIQPHEVVCGWHEIEQAVMKLHPEDLPQTSHIESERASVEELKEDQPGYEKAFERFMEPLEKRKFQKIVLSRSASRPVPDKLSFIHTFCDACNTYPRMFIYLCHTPVTGTWIGSTPEALLRGAGNKWRTVALAGTQAIVNEVIPSEWNSKNREEQAIVANYIRDVLHKFGKNVKEEGPYTARAGQLIHIKTDFSCVLKNNEHLGELLQDLHPTPAVCGLPKQETYSYILENEGYDRKYYSGFIGWLDPSECTDLYVNLRCMEINDQEATLYAGGGILTSSDCEQEWKETVNKMDTMNKLFTL